MADIIRMQDLTHTEISELLAVNGDRLCDGQTTAIQTCVDDINSIKRACDVLDMMNKLNEAA